jgi:hypothetical protein
VAAWAIRAVSKKATAAARCCATHRDLSEQGQMLDHATKVRRLRLVLAFEVLLEQCLDSLQNLLWKAN